MILETIKTFFLQLRDVFLRFQFIPDFFDILLVALVIYAVIIQLRKTKSIQVIRGILLIAVVYGIVALFGMSASSYLFRRLFNDIILIVIVLFADELRQALENVGKQRIGKKLPFLRRGGDDAEIDAINAVCRACERYEAVLEKYRNGGYPPKKKPPIDLLRIASGSIAAINKLHYGIRDIQNDLKEENKLFQEQMAELFSHWIT